MYLYKLTMYSQSLNFVTPLYGFLIKNYSIFTFHRDEAERQINWDVKNSEYRLDELQTASKSAQYRKEVQLKEHLSTEKDLRAKR